MISHEAFKYQGLAIVVAAKNHNPTVLNPDFLKRNNIVPEDWELSQPPICLEPIAQVSFSTGVSIVAQTDTITFSENLDSRDLNALQIPNIALQYIETLKHVNYLAIGINPQGYTPFASKNESWEYIRNKLFAAGSWQSSANGLITSAIQLVFGIDNGYFSLNIAQGGILNLEEKICPEEETRQQFAIIFSGNFHRELRGQNSDDRLTEARSIIENWKTDINLFASIIENKFLEG